MRIDKIKILLLLLLLGSCNLCQDKGEADIKRDDIEEIKSDENVYEDFGLQYEENIAIRYLKDTLMNFKYFIPGVYGLYREFYKMYALDEFYSLIDSFGKSGLKTVAGSILEVLKSQAEAEDAVSNIKDAIERYFFEIELSENWYRKVLKVACDDPSKAYNDLVERSVKVKDVFKEIQKSAEVASKIYDTFNLDIYDKRAIRYMLHLYLLVNNYDYSGLTIEPYTKYKLYDLLVAPPFGAANIKNCLKHMRGVMRQLYIADVFVDKVEIGDPARETLLRKRFDRQKALYDQFLKAALKNLDLLYDKLGSDEFINLNRTAEAEFKKIAQ
ncbi:hypothetical protein baBA2_000917 (plasmid) [Borrelia anserina]|uniref:Lipoprotein n=1 Tax=Borrelia anserina Es TaxID=1365188 RepID=A0ABM6FW02_BORAN|nr:hypothetical protein [Borrelia anserina]APR65323.1 hypothetical protein N187_A04 [Borrelia anserina Es]UPA07291.1 hypothetical protein baBA2_000917 [Borrelia anserina]